MLCHKWAVGILLLLLTISSQAAITRPNAGEGKAKEILVFGAVLDIDKIDSAEQNFTLNFYTIFRWKDGRLAHEEQGSVIHKPPDIWNPRLTIMNTQRIWQTTKDEVEISPDGEVTYRLHVFGDFSQPLDLHDFPHDSHVFEVPVVAAGYRPEEVFSRFRPKRSRLSHNIYLSLTGMSET